MNTLNKLLSNLLLSNVVFTLVVIAVVSAGAPLRAQLPEAGCATSDTANLTFDLASGDFTASASYVDTTDPSLTLSFQNITFIPDVPVNNVSIVRNADTLSIVFLDFVGPAPDSVIIDFACVSPLEVASKPGFGAQDSASEESDAPVRMYPNPASDQLNFSNEVSYIRLYDRQGRTILERRNVQTLKLPDDLSSGLYLVQIGQYGETRRLIIR